MAVKIGKSYVSEAAMNYAESVSTEKTDAGGVLKELAEKFPNANITVGNAPFGGTGLNNIAISPNILRQMATDPEKRKEYEALIYDCNETSQKLATSMPGGRTMQAHGFIIDGNGNLSSWGISKSDDGTVRSRTALDKNDKKSWLDKMLGNGKKTAKKSATKKTREQSVAKSKEKKAEKSGEKNFADIKALGKYLRENFAVVKNGTASISQKYLRECLDDADKQKSLFDNLAAADRMFDDAKENIEGFRSMKVRINDDGSMETETSGGKVAVNEEKRSRQITSAKSGDDIAYVMRLLEEDLTECEEGVKNNMCDEEEVRKVKQLIERAKQRMAEVKNDEASPADEAAFAVNILI